MGKVKIKRKSTLIDMTAMSDVTVLLLTFFMLTSTFLAKEPTTVKTPSSVSVEAIPSKDLVTILVSAEDQTGKMADPTAIEGKIFMSFTGDSTINSESLRKAILEQAVGIYNQKCKELNKPTIALDTTQINTFAKMTMFGCSFKDLGDVLKMDATAREKFMSDLTKSGIPTNDNKDKTDTRRLSDFQIWLKALSSVAQEGRDNAIMEQGLDQSTPEGRDAIRKLDILYNAVFQGKSVTVKADKDTPFTVIHHVFDNLQTMGLNKFTLMTNLKNEEGD